MQKIGGEKNEKNILEVTEQDRIKLEFEKCKPIKGKDCTFIFPLLYEARANAFAKQKNIEIIGCYHSHAQYPSIFSDVDNNILKPYWASDKLCMIFSPKYFTLNCETVFKDKTTEKVDVFIKDWKKIKN